MFQPSIDGIRKAIHQNFKKDKKFSCEKNDETCIHRYNGQIKKIRCDKEGINLSILFYTASSGVIFKKSGRNKTIYEFYDTEKKSHFHTPVDDISARYIIKELTLTDDRRVRYTRYYNGRHYSIIWKNEEIEYVMTTTGNFVCSFTVRNDGKVSSVGAYDKQRGKIHQTTFHENGLLKTHCNYIIQNGRIQLDKNCILFDETGQCMRNEVSEIEQAMATISHNNGVPLRLKIKTDKNGLDIIFDNGLISKMTFLFRRKHDSHGVIFFPPTDITKRLIDSFTRNILND